MNAEETRLLRTFLDQLTTVRDVAKDPDADALIRDGFSRQPNAAYLVVQRAMILEQALEQAKAEMAQLRHQASRASAPAQGGFLDANAWGKSARSRAEAGAGPEWSAAGTPMATGGMRAASGAASYPAHSKQFGGLGSRFGGGAGSSFLGTMAATAAGVAGGAFLFHGIGNLLDGREEGASDSAQTGNGAEADATPPQSLAEPDAGTEDLASAGDSGSFFDDPFSGDAGSGDLGGGEDSLL